MKVTINLLLVSIFCSLEGRDLDSSRLVAVKTDNAHAVTPTYDTMHLLFRVSLVLYKITRVSLNVRRLCHRRPLDYLPADRCAIEP